MNIFQSLCSSPARFPHTDQEKDKSPQGCPEAGNPPKVQTSCCSQDHIRLFHVVESVTTWGLMHESHTEILITGEVQMLGGKWKGMENLAGKWKGAATTGGYRLLRNHFWALGSASALVWVSLQGFQPSSKQNLLCLHPARSSSSSGD